MLPYVCIFSIIIKIKSTITAIKGDSLSKISSNVHFLVVPICEYPPMVTLSHCSFEYITDISHFHWKDPIMEYLLQAENFIIAEFTAPNNITLAPKPAESLGGKTFKQNESSAKEDLWVVDETKA